MYSRAQMCKALRCSLSLLEVYDHYGIFIVPGNPAQGKRRVYTDVDLYRGLAARVLRTLGVPYREIQRGGINTKNKKEIERLFSEIVIKGIELKAIAIDRLLIGGSHA